MLFHSSRSLRVLIRVPVPVVSARASLAPTNLSTQQEVCGRGSGAYLHVRRGAEMLICTVTIKIVWVKCRRMQRGTVSNTHVLMMKAGLSYC